MLIEGGDRRAARWLWRQIQQSEEPWLQKSAERTLLQLDALDAIDQLQEIVRKVPPPAGTPFTWEYLVRQRALAGPPLDAGGALFALNPDTGEVTLAEASPLFPLPRHSRRPQ